MKREKPKKKWGDNMKNIELVSLGAVYIYIYIYISSLLEKNINLINMENEIAIKKPKT